MKTETPPVAYLHECFSYNERTGSLTWKARPLHHFKRETSRPSWIARNAGKEVGTPNRDGHIRFPLKPFGQFTAHRVIWAMVTGEWPKAVDHKNRNPADNRWENLREATTQQNQWNRRHTGKLPRGVVPDQRGNGRFMARANAGGKFTYIGTYDTPERAHEAWRIFVRRERGEFFRAD